MNSSFDDVKIMKTRAGYYDELISSYRSSEVVHRSRWKKVFE
jgi:hypothetical protein